jgi:hypothetical protein
MLLTSSEIQKKLERGAFLIHIAHKRIEALQAEIAGHEEQMHDTAQSLYGNPSLVEAAIAMANMSIPAIEMKASKLVAESQQSSSAPVSAGEALTALLDPSVSAHELDGDDSTVDDDAVVVEPVTDGTGLAKLHAEEFFGVEVPASQIDLAREIKHEAAVSVKQNTKNNTYASDRGKNAWRKALFTRARAEYLKAGVPSDGLEDASVADLVEDPEVAEDAVVEAVIEAQATVVDVVVPSSDAVVEAEEVAGSDIEPLTELGPSDDAVQYHTGDDHIIADEEDPVDVDAIEAEVAEPDNVEPVTVESVDSDEQWSPETEDDYTSASSDEPSEASSAGFVDIPFFDEPSDAVDSDLHSDETSVEAVSTVNDDQTLSITDTFFSDDDVAVLDPISFDEETGDHSDHDDMSTSDEPEDIDVPDFDPNAELFDGITETPVAETPAVPTDEPAVVEVSSSFVNERLVEAAQQPTPEASRRAVPISSIPAHQRPGAPRPQAAAPSRPQPGAAPGRVVTMPASRPAPSVSQQSAVPTAPASSPAPPSPSPAATVAPTASAPSRSAPVRSAPARSGDTPARTHGYGAKVPAPPGLDEAIRERDAAAAAAKAAASTAPASAAPARPAAPPVRPGPGAPRGPAFTKPTFGR